MIKTSNPKNKLPRKHKKQNSNFGFGILAFLWIWDFDLGFFINISLPKKTYFNQKSSFLFWFLKRWWIVDGGW
jgi:hypothetical protein